MMMLDYIYDACGFHSTVTGDVSANERNVVKRALTKLTSTVCLRYDRCRGCCNGAGFDDCGSHDEYGRYSDCGLNNCR